MSTMVCDKLGALYVRCDKLDMPVLGLDPDIPQDYDEFLRVTKFIVNDGEVSVAPVIVSVDCSCFHALAIDVHGNLWACGCHKYGRLGLGDYSENVTYFTLVGGIPSVVKVSGSSCFGHSLILDNKGRVWGCGSNGDGELGLPISHPEIDLIDSLKLFEQLTDSSYPKIVDILAYDLCSLLLGEDGRVWSFGNRWPSLTSLPTKPISAKCFEGGQLPHIKMLGACASHPCLLDNEGCVWVYGHPMKKIDGKGVLFAKASFRGFARKKAPVIVAIASGLNNLLALDKCGNVWSYDSSDQFVLLPVSRVVSINVQDYSSFLVDEQGRSWFAECERNKPITFRRLNIDLNLTHRECS